MSYHYKSKRNRSAVFKISTTSLVKLLILNFLIKKDCYGNELIESIKETSNNKWEPSPGMIYPLLRDLEDQGYIKGRWKEPDKRSIRYYKITEDGIEHFKVIKRNYKIVLNESLDMVNAILKEIYN